MAIHDVEMQNGGSAALHGGDLFRQAGIIRTDMTAGAVAKYDALIGSGLVVMR